MSKIEIPEPPCNCLELLRKQLGIDGPFYRPVSIDWDTGDMKVTGWAVRTYKKTKAGNISEKGQRVMLLTYCPICGERLLPEETESPTVVKL